MGQSTTQGVRGLEWGKEGALFIVGRHLSNLGFKILVGDKWQFHDPCERSLQLVRPLTLEHQRWDQAQDRTSHTRDAGRRRFLVESKACFTPFEQTLELGLNLSSPGA